MQQFSANIFSNSKISNCFYEMVFSWKPNTIPLPGQFVTIRAEPNTSPLLRRPFALSGFYESKKRCSIIYQKRGPVTTLLAGKSPDEQIDIIGPLGNPFPIPGKKNKAILIAGGTGIGPVVFLCSRLKNLNLEYISIFGAKTKSSIPDNQFIKQNFVICTDDGSAGYKGTTTDYLKSISNLMTSDTILFACGPQPMLKSCNDFACSHKLPCYVSVEQIMACGVGACMGCAIKITKEPGFARACKEGPVFKSTEIDWN
ncbi:MAG: dihydroorotate dehydrogenase electron transfer subunit [Fibrobacter sp.]|nr:dihydroorotate dehydrogenase electron transfer subunit [Fibrobacter sp.]